MLFLLRISPSLRDDRFKVTTHRLLLVKRPLSVYRGDYLVSLQGPTCLFDLGLPLFLSDQRDRLAGTWDKIINPIIITPYWLVLQGQDQTLS